MALAGVRHEDRRRSLAGYASACGVAGSAPRTRMPASALAFRPSLALTDEVGTGIFFAPMTEVPVWRVAFACDVASHPKVIVPRLCAGPFVADSDNSSG